MGGNVVSDAGARQRRTGLPVDSDGACGQRVTSPCSNRADDCWAPPRGIIRIDGAGSRPMRPLGGTCGRLAGTPDLYDPEQGEDRRRGDEVALADAEHTDGKIAALGQLVRLRATNAEDRASRLNVDRGA